MYAIVEIAGKQFKVTQDQFVYAPKMEGDEGASVEFDKVLLLDNDGKVEVGAPVLKGVKVSGKILGHVKGDKVIVFKKKRRKGYKKKNGHRQEFTKIQISDIVSGGKATKKSESKPKAESKPKTESKPKAKADDKKGDDLTKIVGIGPVFAGQLNELGYTTFKQISSLTRKQVEEIAEKIDGVSVESSASWINYAQGLIYGENDLTEINGIGPVFAGELKKLGYISFRQIAELKKKDIEVIAEEIDGVSEELIENEEWIKQAKDLMK